MKRPLSVIIYGKVPVKISGSSITWGWEPLKRWSYKHMAAAEAQFKMVRAFEGLFPAKIEIEDRDCDQVLRRSFLRKGANNGN